MNAGAFDMFLREVAEDRGWIRELEEKIEQLASEKQEMIRKMIEDGVPLEKVQEWAGCKITFDSVDATNIISADSD